MPAAALLTLKIVVNLYVTVEIVAGSARVYITSVHANYTMLSISAAIATSVHHYRRYRYAAMPKYQYITIPTCHYISILYTYRIYRIHGLLTHTVFHTHCITRGYAIRTHFVRLS
jgi:hypothetical protein